MVGIEFEGGSARISLCGITRARLRGDEQRHRLAGARYGGIHPAGGSIGSLSKPAETGASERVEKSNREAPPPTVRRPDARAAKQIFASPVSWG